MMITAGFVFCSLFFVFFFWGGGGEHGVRGGGSSRNLLYQGEKCMITDLMITVYQTPLKLSGNL